MNDASGSSLVVENWGTTERSSVEDLPYPFQGVVRATGKDGRAHHGARVRSEHIGPCASEQPDDVGAGYDTDSGAIPIAHDDERRDGIRQKCGDIRNGCLSIKHSQSSLR